MDESDESDVIVEILSNISKGEGMFFNPYISPHMQTIRAYGLIVDVGKHTNVSEAGYEVIRIGSFDKWLSAKKRKEEEIHKAAMGTAKATVDAARSAKWSQYAAFVAAIAAVAALIIPLVISEKKKSDTTRPDSTINILRDRVNKLDSLVKLQKQAPKKPMPVASPSS